MRNNLSIYIALVIVVFLTSCQKIKIIKAHGSVDQEEFTVTFPFELRQGVIVMEVNLKGKPFEFILDTGGFNLIDKKIAEEIDLKGKTSIDIPDSNGNERDVPLLKLDQMEIAGINFLGTGTGIVDFEDLNAVGCLELKGMIGSNLMQNAIWEIDYQKQEITITHSMETLDIPSTSYAVPFTTGTFKSPNVDLFLNGQIENKVEIDLGSTGTFSLAQSTLDKLTLTNTVSGTGLYKAGVYGYGNPETLNFATIDQLSLGNLNFTNQLVNFKAEGTSTIGNDFLKNYRVIFNWFENEITLIPAITPETPSLETFGIKPIFNDKKPLIGFIYENSSAAASGLKITDELIKVNGQNIQNISQSEWCDVKNQFYQPTKNLISITVQRGREVLNFELKKSKLL